MLQQEAARRLRGRHRRVALGARVRLLRRRSITSASTGKRVPVEVEPRYFRPSEVDHLCGDASKARAKLGWSPRMSFAQLVVTRWPITIPSWRGRRRLSVTPDTWRGCARGGEQE